jgi:hypothetical protein
MKRGILVLALILAGLSPAPAARPGPGSPSLEAYRGLASWVDLFEERAWRRPAKAVADMQGHGVRTVFLQTSNYSQRRTIADPAAVSRFIETAHAGEMSVVAWYLPGFADLRRDLRRSSRAINFRTSSGQRFDSFALDIEASIVDPPSRRTKRLLTLSRRIRERVGPGYPLGAVIPSPVGIGLAKDYWPGFPYAQLGAVYDVFVPMGYFTYHVSGAGKVHDETALNIRMIREAAGDPSVPIHVIGGIADEAGAAEMRAFVQAVREHGVLGASLYNWSLTRDHDWAELERVPTNPRQAVALPLALPWTDPVGNIPGEDGTHPKEVWFEAPGIAGPRTLTFDAFDVQPGEVEIWVNWQLAGVVDTTVQWGSSQTVPIQDATYRDAGTNLIGFVAAGDHPDWSEWGVRNVALG